MTYEPLHHKYRPQTFADLVGQEAIAQTLTNAIRSKRIAPAYLFTGSRGTGKTSSARILAKSLNCLSSNIPTDQPCGVCDVCFGITKGSALDVIEIDAASNTGVDNIREIIERAQYSPVQCRYKVYVIDEVHSLSTAAFNALLKTLEEPPKHVVFVLATTDPQRVLPTIISRCQRFDFRRIPLEAMVGHLLKIAQLENINITVEAMTLVAQVAQGGLRDAESLLDQLSLLSGQVTVEAVWDLVGAVPERDLMDLLQAIASNNPEAVLDKTRKLMDRGREPLIVLQNFAGFYRDLLIAKKAPNRPDLVALTAPTWKALCEFEGLDISTILQGQKQLKDSEVQIKNTTQPRLWLEVTLLGLLPDSLQSQKSVAQVPEFRVNNQPAKPESPKSAGLATPDQPSPSANLSPKEQTPPPQRENPQPTSPVSAPAVSAQADSVAPTTQSTVVGQQSELEQVWQQVLDCLPLPGKALFSQHGYLLDIKGQIARVGISSPQLLNNYAKPKLASLEAAFQEVLQHKVKVNFQVGTAADSQSATQSRTSSQGTTPPSLEVKEHSAANYQAKPSQNQMPSKVPPQERIEANKKDSTAERTPPSVQAPSSWQEDELAVRSDTQAVAIAAKRLADYFHGDIVNENGDLELIEPEIPQPPAQDIISPAPEPEQEWEDDDYVDF